METGKQARTMGTEKYVKEVENCCDTEIVTQCLANGKREYIFAFLIRGGP
jgi:hypothetical protein